MVITFILGILTSLIAIGFAIWLLKPRIYEVTEDERYIVYQQDHFKRIVGPGPILIWEGFEKVERKLNVRNEPKDIVINELFIYDIPFGYKLNVWSCFDPAMLRGLGPTQMAKLVQFDDNERHQRVIVKIRDALVNSIEKVQDAHGGIPDSLIGKVLLITPGLDGYNLMMQHVRNELEQTLPTTGTQLDPRQPITATKLYLMPEIVGILNRDRIVEQIGTNFPSLSPTEKIQALSVIDGITIPPVYSVFSSEFASGHARAELVDIRQGKDGAEVRTRIKPGNDRSTPAAAEDEFIPTEESANSQPEQDVADYKLKPSDLAVLKRVA